MSYNLVNPTTGDLTRVAGGLDTSIIPSDASASNKLATTDSTLKTIQLSGSVDCNTLTEPGLYTASAGAVISTTNTPADIGPAVQLDGGFSVLVTKTNVDSVYYGMQMFIPYGSDSPFIRKSYYLNGQYWTDWQQLVTESNLMDIPIETDRTITFSNDYTEVSIYRCGYSNIRAHIEIDTLCNITPHVGWIQDMGIVLPEGYRPHENISITAWCHSDTESHTPITLMIGADGRISGYVGQSHTLIDRLNITVTYFK